MTNAKDGSFKYQIIVKLDGLPPTLNRLNSMHPMARARLNKKWRESVMWAIKSNIPITPLKRAKITITRHSSVEGDGDNYTAGYKGIVDSLRYLKIISDDRISNIGNIETPWTKEKPKKGFIELKIEEL